VTAGLSYLSAKLRYRTSNTRTTSPTRCMQVGLRPRLKGRPSFYDLIKQRNVDQLSIATAKLVEDQPNVAAAHLPLPVSPTSTKELALSPPPTPKNREEIAPPEIQKSGRMVPVCMHSLFSFPLTAELEADCELVENVEEISG
jgi:hypothetical protein